MKIYDTPQTKNPCYKSARRMTPMGILVHSTGANNPWMKRYVDAPAVLGVNPNNNHWNKASATKCMHAFIGKDITGAVAVAQTAPYTIASWGCGKGANGSYNRDPTGHIQFEICEDGLNSEAYYREAFGVAEDYCAYLCQQYGIPASAIVGHYEAAQRGYASNHADPRHWMSRFGDNMDAFRARVAARLGGKIPDQAEVAMVLRIGSVGESVRELQQSLMKLGYDVGKNTRADGKFGPATEAGVRAFQADYLLPATGIWGDADARTLAAALKEDNPLPFEPDDFIDYLLRAREDALALAASIDAYLEARA